MATYYKKDIANQFTLTWIFNEGESRQITEDDTTYESIMNEHTEDKVSQGSGVTQMSEQDGAQYFQDMTDWIQAIPGSRPPRKPTA